MNTKEFIDRRNKVFAFMESIELEREALAEDERFMNSPEMKMKKLNDEKEKGRRYCINKIMTSMYKNALPLSNDYKIAYGDELQGEIQDFISNNPMERDYYVTDTYANSPAMRRINKTVTDLIESKFEDIENNIDSVDSDKIEFKPDEQLDDVIQRISDDMGIDDVTNTINNNVKSVAQNEIERAKNDKETRKDIERQLAENLNITTKEAVDNYLELHDLNSKRDFKPRLFQGIMIGKTRELMEKYECGEYHNKSLFNALETFNHHDREDSGPMEEAFVESVKEFTKLSILKSLKLDDMNFYKTDSLASKYSQM